MGNPIPFDFHDIRSFADLYYAPKSKSFVAITLFYDDKTDLTKASIYTLMGPPLAAEQGMNTVVNPLTLRYILYAGLLVIVLLIGWWLYQKNEQGQDCPLRK
ncbi:hypothetical protein KUH03_07900 [Sphingobacterium sp. E70]|uniref:hypothetical protein n=1 Tax=Sphingobacterium sp. E70 TaxID=2853439 RepID=UPI00211CC7ED|nr:hypothetical protein [Sphingobacterium sp. E70]ULT26745.1 hypothetical protein KUH03_07900 [Sphingobacterium sp. E70]